MALPALLLVGGGRMGTALLSGWQKQGLAPSIVIDPAPVAARPGVTVLTSPDEIPPDFAPAAVILAVKPQMAATALPDYLRFGGAIFISIMAGKTIAGIGALVGSEQKIIRAMPNTPAAIGQGITVAFAGPAVSAAQRALAQSLLAATGAVEWVDREALLDPVTAISGGGPAYLFLLTELMEQAGLAQGLPADLAKQLARQTVIGAAALLAASPEEPAALRRAVTSPAGTTERALDILLADGAWPAIFARAIAAATNRSAELSDL